MNTWVMYRYPFLFPKVYGRLVRRVNRFVAEVDIGGRREEAYLANPGRLWELFLPGTELILSPNLSKGKMPFTVLACLKDGRPVLLHTHLTNKIIHHLIGEGRLEGFKDYRVIQAEPACGRHRFDLLLKHDQSGADYYLEVKTCTLFAGRLAMFPDAVTKRGSDHLYKLSELSGRGVNAGCLFVVMNPETDYFLPAYHIDPAFATAFRAVKDQVQLSSVALGFDPGFNTVNNIKSLRIPLELLNSEMQDGGAYLLIIRLEEDKTIAVGSLGQYNFKQGYYVYAGSARRNLGKRVARHTRKRKQKRWHIDYLIANAAKITPVPVISTDDLECELAGKLEQIATIPFKGFGSSDCRCPAHLFYFAENPLEKKGFIDLVQYYRLRRLEQKIDRGF